MSVDKGFKYLGAILMWNGQTFTHVIEVKSLVLFHS
jgi:hypothetical protein